MGSNYVKGRTIIKELAWEEELLTWRQVLEGKEREGLISEVVV